MGLAQEKQRNGDHAEQLSLLSPEELEPRRPEGDAVQDELPFRR